MKYFIAFLITILLHISLYLYINKKDIKQIYTSKNKTNNISVQYVNLHKKSLKKQVKKTSAKKKTIKKVKKKERKKQVKKITHKKKIIKKVKTNTNKQNIVNSYNKNTKKINSDIYKENIKEQYSKKIPKIDPLTKEFIDLYGDKFNQFDKQTKLFLMKNIKNIGTITQRYLQYPYLSVQAQQSGVNVVSFILHPNGEISQLKIDKSSNYFLLDDNTIETIQEAYLQYPAPNKPTLIKIFVKYELR